MGRINLEGNIFEFPVPKTQENVILAGLAFDGEGDLWVQQYVDANNPYPAGQDHLVRIGRAILNAPPGDLSGVPITWFSVPTRETVMHRILRGPDGDRWFTELKADKRSAGRGWVRRRSDG